MKSKIWKTGYLRNARKILGLALPVLFVVVLGQYNSTEAATGINQQLAFQGKVVKSDGTNLPDGNYNMEFKIYQDGDGQSANDAAGSPAGSLKWTEDHLVSGGASSYVKVTSGTFAVNLGSQNSFGSSVDWNQDTLWLSIQVGSTSSCTPAGDFHTNCSGDGEMVPMIRLTAVPYAMNANKVGGLTASQLVQLSPTGQQTGSINVSSNITSGGTVQSNTLDAATASTQLVVGSSNASSISLAKNVSVASSATISVLGSNGLILGSTTAAGGILFQDGTSNNYKVTLTTPSLGGSYTLGWPTAGASGSQCMQSTSGSTSSSTFLQWGSCDYIAALGTVDGSGSANANGATVTSGTLYLNSADATHPGVVNATTQTFGGDKTFSGNLSISSGKTLTVGSLQSCLLLTTSSGGTLGCNSGAASNVSRLEISGHSYAYGVGASAFSQRFTTKLAQMLHAQELNHGEGSAVAAYNQAGTSPPDGGYARVLQDVTNTRTAAPYQSLPGVGLIEYGINDMAMLTPSGFDTPFKNAMRTIIARYRAGAVFEETSGTIAYGGTWNTNACANDCSGSSSKQPSANGNTVTISVPSDFPGGAASVDVGLVATGDGNGAIYNWTVDGSSAGSTDTRNQGASGHKTGMVKRFTGLSAGSHTIVGTIASLTGSTTFDYWQIEAPTPRLVAVMLANRMYTYAIYGAGCPSTPGANWNYCPTDSDISTINTDISSVAAEFDSSVITVATDSVLNKQSANFNGDGGHPNDLGHSLLASALYKAIVNAPFTSDQAAAAAAGVAYTGNQIVFQNSNDSTTAFQIQNAAASTTLLNVDTTNGLIGIGTNTPAYQVDVRGNTNSQIHLNNSSADGSGFIFGGFGGIFASANASWSGSANLWEATAATASIMQTQGGNFVFKSDTGLTAGNTYTATTRFTVTSAGVVTLLGGQSQDITTANSASGTAAAITLQPGSSGVASGTGASLTLTGGVQSGTTSIGGSITINGGTGTSTNGSVNIGISGTSAVNLAASGITTATGGNLTVKGGAATLGTASAAGSLIIQDGSGHTATINMPTVATYTLSLPTSGATGSQCLSSTSGSTSSASALQWTACGGISWPLTYSGTMAFQPSGVANSVLQLLNNASATSGITITGTTSDPILATTGTTNLSLQPASGVVMLNRVSTNNELRVYENSATPTNYATITYANNTAIYGASAGVAQLGSASGPVTMPLTGINDTFLFTKTYTPTATYSNSEFGIQRNITGATNYLSNGNVVSIQDMSNGTNASSAPNILYLNQNNTTFVGNLIQAQTGGATTRFSVDVLGNVTASNGYKVGSSAGQNLSCSSGQSVQSATVSGGIITGGSCSGSTLQSAYDNSSTPATITTSSATKGVLIKAGSTYDQSALFQVQSSGSIPVISVDTSNLKLQVGSGTTDTNLVLFEPDSYSTFDDSGVSCSTTVNQGAFYYNTASGSLRTCRSSGWEDVVTTAALGLQLFGVVPDSGSNPGDLSDTTGLGPCEVEWASTTSVSVNSCVAYSGGRKVIVQSTSFTTSGASGNFQHICLNGTGNQPAISTAGAENANLPTWSVAAPVLCLADIKLGTSNAIAGLYDVRTYTTTNKTFTAVPSTNASPALGMFIMGTTTAGEHIVTPKTAASIVAGVIVATSGVAATGTSDINVVYAYSGPATVKATAGSINAKVETGTGAFGYAITGTTTTVATIAGIAQNAWSNTCTSVTTCNSSLFFLLSPR